MAAPGSSADASELRVGVLEVPDLVVAFVGDVEAQRVRLERDGARWRGGSGAAGVEVGIRAGDQESVVTIAAAGAVQRVHLRWKRPFSEGCRVLGDAWERSYGDLEWLPVRAERPLPWYALVSAGKRTSGFGVKVGAGAFAFWQVDVDGVSLWLDVRNGGNGVVLGKRMLEAARIRSYVGREGESAFAVARGLCRRLAEGVEVPQARGGMSLKAIYGSNDWYYAYGRNTAAGILRDAELMRELAPGGEVKPFTVIDDGYQDAARFPSMARLAEEIRRRGVVPGIWIRPLRAKAGTPEGMRLPAARWRADVGGTAPPAYDPTVPEGMKAVVDVVVEARDWGYALIKHDFTTFELLGQWGSQMGASPALPGWHLNDRTRTNAEVVAELYREIRQACGEDRVILGCNTVGHLAVGIFDAQRTGDDVSGRDWERTRRMGVNTLAYRLAQHRSFFAVDADCVAVTPEVPWAMTEQWLRVVAKSGSVLLVSPDPNAVGAREKAAIREAFAACMGGSASEPGDWMNSRTPMVWGEDRYRWIEEDGASPWPIGVGLQAEVCGS
jgi:alpha-galactosidase